LTRFERTNRANIPGHGMIAVNRHQTVACPLNRTQIAGTQCRQRQALELLRFPVVEFLTLCSNFRAAYCAIEYRNSNPIVRGRSTF
jgi:hypothetical protein